MDSPADLSSLLDDIVRHLVDGILVVDREGVVRFVNPAACALLGRPADALLGAQLGLPMSTDAPVEITLLDPQGHPRIVELRAGESRWEGETAFLASLRDISDRVRAEQDRARAQRETEALLEAARGVLSAPDFTAASAELLRLCKVHVGASGGYFALRRGEKNEVLVLDAGGAPCTVDPDLPMPVRGLRAEAYARREAIFDNAVADSPHAALFPPGHVPLQNVLFAPILVGDEAVGLLGLGNKPDGFTDEDARFATSIGTVVALAIQRDRTLQDLREARALLVSTGRLARIGGWEYDVAKRRLTWSTVTREIHDVDEGYDPNLDDAFTFYPPPGRERLRAAFQAALEHGVPYDLELRFVTARGRELWVRTQCVPRFADDRVVSLQGTFQDVTPIREAQDLRAASEARFRHLFVNSLAPIVIADDQGRYLDVNPAACDMFGYDRETFLRMSVADLATTSLDDAGEQYEAHLTSAEGQGVFRFRRADGEPRVALWSAARISDTEHASVLRDITDLVTVRRSLEQARDRAQQYLDVAAVMLLALDREGRVTLINRRGCEILGIEDARQVVGTDWFRFVPLEDRDQVRAIFQEILAGRVTPHERVQGAVLTVSGETRQVLWHNAAVRDAGGAIIGTLSSGADVTEQRRLQDQLVQAQRMEAVGRLAGGVAHDFNNLLTVILATTQLVLPELRDSDPLYHDLRQILDAGKRAERLTRQLLAFSRRQVLQPRELDLNALVTDMERMLRRLIGEDIALRTATASDLWTVKADPGQVEQIIANLAVNARDAMPKGGKLTFETQNVELDERYAATHPEVTAGPHVLLAVTDTGNGMSEETLHRIFEPFFTTKQSEHGTGLGLATVYGIVKQHGGHLSVYSEVGVGTTFKVYLPRAARRPGSRPTTTQRATDAGPTATGETILLVEDEPAVRRLALRLLEHFGYRVIAARNGLEAISLAERHGASLDLLVSDVVMPEMSGPELAERLTRDHPGLRVLFMSGYTDDAIVRHGVLEEGTHFLQKPFDPAVLARKVREVLDGEG